MTSRVHGFAIALVLGLGSVTAAYAVIVTGNVADNATKPEIATNQAIAARAHKLDMWAASLDKTLASRPPALPARARYASVILVSPPGSMALPTPAAIPRPPTLTSVALTPKKHAASVHTSPQPARRSDPKTAPGAPDGDRKDDDEEAPVLVAAPPPAEVAAPMKTEVAAPQAAAPSAPIPQPTTLSAKQAAEQQCRIILRAAEGKSEKEKHAAENQCEALKQAAEKQG